MKVPDLAFPYSVRECPAGDRGPKVEAKFQSGTSYGVWHDARREWTLSAVWTLDEANSHIDLLSTGWHQALADLRAGVGFMDDGSTSLDATGVCGCGCRGSGTDFR